MSPKEQAFVREYLLCLNGAEAARRAGYAPKTADRTAYKLLRKTEVAAAVAAGQVKAEAAAEKTLDDVVRELSRIAFTGMSKFLTITPDGDPMVDLSNCTPADLDLLAEATLEDFKEGRGEDARDVRRIKIKPMDRMNALITLGKHLGLKNKAEEAQTNNLANALREFANRNASAAPIRAEYEGGE